MSKSLIPTLKGLALALGVTLLTVPAFAISANCTGTTRSGLRVELHYFTNTSSDNNADYYAKIRIGQGAVATYALSVRDAGLIGSATLKSQTLGANYGRMTLHIYNGGQNVTGVVGHMVLNPLNCKIRD